MTGDKKVKFIIDTVFAAIVLLLCIFAVKYLVWWLLPLVAGFAIALVLRPVVNLFYRHSSATRRFCATIVLLLAYAGLFALLWLGLVRLVAGLREVFLSLPAYYESTIAPGLGELNQTVSELLRRFFPKLGDQFRSLSELLSEQLGSSVSGISARVIARASAVVGGIPTVMITFLFTVLSSFFISLDYDQVASFLARLVPKRHRKTLFDLKDFLVGSVFQYAKAYLTLLLITFAECWAGLALLRVPGSGWWAAAIALADLLPAIGTGLILLPWGALALLQGNQFLGIGLLILWGVISLVRSLIEPKVVGDRIGLPPLVTITAMFLGLKVLGVFGMFLAPVVALIIKFLCDSGRLHLWDAPSKG